ncbi:MAG: MFS transporter [Corynebacterium sp.]|uniref:MFS transporter n=1 Tax=Corynebacterium sp. TaxID=1720 RepID=UPI0026DAD273|nr:MFS transporter [Corynebacterium sp.]MDO4762259.1 MFS transporter [Corynebacterium sp.]
MNIVKNNPAFARLQAAHVLNELGLAISYVIIPLTILTVYNSPFLAGLISALCLAARTLSAIFSGAIADRINPSLLLKASFGAEFLLWGALALLLYFQVANVYIIALLSIIVAAISTIDGPAEFVVLKRIMPTAELGAATSITEARSSTAQLVGNPIGGALYSLGGAAALGIQAAIHCVAALCVPQVRDARTPGAEDTTSAPRFFTEVKYGFRLVFGDTALRHLMYVSSIANLGVVPMSFVLLTVFQQKNTDSWIIGILLSCFGVGVILGAPLAARLSSTVRLSTLLIIALSMFVLTTLGLIVGSAHPLSAGILVIISGLALPALNSAITSYTVAVTEEKDVGKVFSASGVFGMILAPLGIFVAGVLLAHVGALWVFLSQALVMALALALSVFSPALSTMPRLSQL